MKYAIRSQFIAPKGKIFISCDLSQAESWVVAYSANENKMKHALAFDDIHIMTAKAIFGDIEIDKPKRYVGKKTNHSKAYRQSAFGLCDSINGESDETGITVNRAEAKRYSDTWDSTYNVKEWWKEIENIVDSERILVTVYGFKRTFYGLKNDELYRTATAFIPQSTVADHCFGAVQPEVGVEGGLLKIYEEFDNTDIEVVHTAHDSVMVYSPIAIVDEVAEKMYNYMYRPLIIRGEQFTIPVDVEIGERWGELEKWKKAA